MAYQQQCFLNDHFAEVEKEVEEDCKVLIVEGIMSGVKTNITLQWMFVKKQLESLCALGKMKENEVNGLKEKTRLVKTHSEVSSTINQLEPILKETRGLKNKIHNFIMTCCLKFSICS